MSDVAVPLKLRNKFTHKPAEKFEIRDYLRLDLFPHFLCPGCGHGIALRALLWAIHDLDIEKDQLAVVSGIGCSGRLSAYIDANTFHTTHGRPIAFATGLKLARPDLHVIVITGDGDCLAIGGNHLIHSRRLCECLVGHLLHHGVDLRVDRLQSLQALFGHFSRRNLAACDPRSNFGCAQTP